MSGAYHVKLAKRVHAAIARAENFLLGQVTRSRPGWGAEPGKDSDPWTTGQLCSLFARSAAADGVLAAVIWLRDVQNEDGSWGSAAHGPDGDTPATACAAIACLQHLGTRSLVAQRAVQWLFNHFENGWTTSPGDPRKRFAGMHHYSTAYGVRALARSPRSTMRSTCLHEALLALSGTQADGAGWGFQPGRPPDPTFTCYVLHGILDAWRIANLQSDERKVLTAVNWLWPAQAKDGSWPDWHGHATSPEATGYALYVLLSAGAVYPSKRLCDAAGWLLDTQGVDGSWSPSAQAGDHPSNWVTSYVVLGLRALRLAAASASAATAPRSKYKLASLQMRNCDDHPGGTGTDAPAPLAMALQETMSGPWTNADTKALYVISSDKDFRDVPHTRPLDHTMFRALDGYVAQKLPEAELLAALQSNVDIEVRGIAPQHLALVADLLGIQSFESIQFRHKVTAGHFNEMRPSFYRARRTSGESVLLVCVFPGHDYVMHYASMVRHFALDQTVALNLRLRVVQYPRAEDRLIRWTGLHAPLVNTGDRVLLGYVLPIRELLESDPAFRLESEHDSDWYGSYRYRSARGDAITLLGVKYCFWGSISAALVHGLCELGVQEIVYAAKLGALSSPDHLYTRIFCPSRYAIMNHDRIVSQPKPPPNGVLRWCPSLDTGWHTSVPTVLEEDYRQRQVMTELGAQSVDNEISQMARAISAFNVAKGQSVSFSAVHFATDYVRAREHGLTETPHDLEKNRTEEARAAKRAIIERIAREVLIPYWLDDAAQSRASQAPTEVREASHE